MFMVAANVTRLSSYDYKEVKHMYMRLYNARRKTLCTV